MAKNRQVVIREWPGEVSNRDPHDAPQAAIDCENVRTHRPGMLTVRRGLAPLEFAGETADSQYAAISLFGYHRPDAEIVIYQDANGSVKAGRNPSL